MKTASASLKFMSSVLSVVLLLDTVLVPVAEAGFWEERRAHTESKSNSPSPLTLASLPVPTYQLDAARDLNGLLPIASNSLRTALPSRPTKNPYKSNDKMVSDILSALPSEYGTVRNIQTPRGRSSKIVIHIQDVHLHTEAQRYISKAIQSLIQQQKINLVGLEGAFGPVSLGGLPSYENRDSVRKAADYALEQNEIAGPVHAALIQPSAVALMGVDDRESYDANVDAYKESAPLLISMKQSIAALRVQLNARMVRDCNPMLLKLLAQKTRYAQGETPIGPYLDFLATQTSLPTELQTFVNALNIEQSLDFQQVEQERASLVTRLESKLNVTETRNLLEYGASCRLGRLGHAQLYGFLMDLCRRHGVTLHQYPAMEAYLHYILLSDGIDGERLVAELAKLETQLSGSLSRNDSERTLLRENRELELVEKLTEFFVDPGRMAGIQIILDSFSIGHFLFTASFVF